MESNVRQGFGTTLPDKPCGVQRLLPRTTFLPWCYVFPILACDLPDKRVVWSADDAKLGKGETVSYSDILTPRADVLSEDGVEGIIDLANLNDKRSKLSQEIYPVQRLAEHLEQDLPKNLGRTVRDIEHDYWNFLAYPVPTHANWGSKAIRRLCQETKLSVCHPRGDYRGQEPDFTDTELRMPESSTSTGGFR